MIKDPDLICFAGDWHMNGNWGANMIRIAADAGAQVILHVGDFGFTFNEGFMKKIRHALDDAGIDLYFVDGNHDEHPKLFKQWRRDEDGFGEPPYGGRGFEKLHYIPRGKRWTWHDKVYMGLGGAHSVDRQSRTPNVDWWYEETISQADLYRATKGGNVDVMITHDVPEMIGVPNDRKSTYWPEAELMASLQNRLMLDEVVREVKPSLLVHGHFHDFYQKQVGQIHVVGLDMDATYPSRNLWFMDAESLTERHVDLPVMAWP